MEESEIRSLVKEQVGRVREAAFRGRTVRVSDGVVDTLTFLLRQVARDPSSRWKEYNADTVQRQAIGFIPNLLADVMQEQRYRSQQRDAIEISSWEVLHGMSRILDRWCPIEKD